MSDRRVSRLFLSALLACTAALDDVRNWSALQRTAFIERCDQNAAMRWMTQNIAMPPMA